MRFLAKQKVEVIGTESGLIGSLHPATILCRLSIKRYMVKYDWLVREDNKSVPLIEAVDEDELRPETIVPIKNKYNIGDVVDVLSRDCWWTGEIVKNYGSYYSVKFKKYRGLFYYRLEKIRMHQVWVKQQSL